MSDPSRLLTQEWREEHAELGDQALDRATDYPDAAWAQAWALIAQAHYAAANIRAKPSGLPVGPYALAEPVMSEELRRG